MLEFYVKNACLENMQEIFGDGKVWLYDKMSKNQIKACLKLFGLVPIW